MADMTQSRRPDFLGAEFDEFLFASIGADASGRSVTVVSALARLDLDPWAEAASLTRLPGAIATQKLAELIALLPGIPCVRFDSSNIAARLTALLPGRSRFPNATRQIPVRMPAAAQALLAPRLVVSLMFIAMAVFLGTQMAMTQFHAAKTGSSAQTAAAAAPIARAPLPGTASGKKTGS